MAERRAELIGPAILNAIILPESDEDPSIADNIQIEGIFEFLQNSQTGESFRFQYYED